MSHRARAPRGSFLLYGLAFAMMLAAGAFFAAAAKGFLESTRLLWVSAGFVVLLGFFMVTQLGASVEPGAGARDPGCWPTAVLPPGQHSLRPAQQQPTR